MLTCALVVTAEMCVDRVWASVQDSLDSLLYTLIVLHSRNVLYINIYFCSFVPIAVLRFKMCAQKSTSCPILGGQEGISALQWQFIYFLSN